MKCPNCGYDNDNSESFCAKCGTALFAGASETADNIENSRDNIDIDIPMNNGDRKSLKNKSKSKKQQTKNVGKNTKAVRTSVKPNFKVIGLIAVLVIIIVLVVIIISSIQSSEGVKIASKVPIGRNIEYCTKETGKEFSNESAYKQLSGVSKFNYVCESDRSVTISGIKLPKWAVLIRTTGVSSSATINMVEYFDFAQLRSGWKGRRSETMFTTDSVSFGMDIKNVHRIVGFDPYYKKITSDNKSVECYRYYMVDEETGLERVFNYFVEYNDVNSTVTNAYYTEIDYVSYVLGMGK